MLRGERRTLLPSRGSGPILSAFEALVGQAGEVEGIRRKLANIRASTVFVASTLGGDRMKRAHFLSSRMTAIHGVRGPLAGAVAAEALFGGPPVTLGEVCLFAASSTFHLYEDHPAYGDAAAWRLGRAKRRAAVCAKHLASDEDELAEAMATISSFEIPQQLLPALPSSAQIIARDALIAAATQEHGQDLRLQLDLTAQRRAEAAMEGLFPEISARLEPDLCFDGDCAAQVEYLVAVAEIDGDQLPLRLVLTNRHRSLLGPFERMPDGAPRPRPPAFGLGSQHKTLLALIALRNGESQLCNQIYGQITNTVGPAPVIGCVSHHQNGWVDLETAIGISMNLPWIDVARRYPDEMSKLEEDLGFLGDPVGPGGAAMGIGRRAPPERFIALFAALGRASLGQPARTEGLSIFEDHPTFAVDLEALGYGHEIIGNRMSVLAAPLNHTGTLRQMKAQLRGSGCNAVIGKTGTTEVNGGGRARSRSATVVVTCGDRTMVVYAGIESTHAGRALGAVNARDLERLIAMALRAVFDGQ